MSDIAQDLGGVVEKLNYCPETGIFTWRVNASAQKQAGSVAGAAHPAGYIKISVNGKFYLAHRLAFVFMLGRMPLKHVDHINGDRTDNRWSNLRECTPAENRQNRASMTSRGHIGVRFDPRRNTWSAKITVNGVSTHLGTFYTEAEAIAAYKAAKKFAHSFSPSLRDDNTHSAEIAGALRDAERYRWLRESRLPPAGERQPAAWIAGRGNEHIECDWLCYEAADAAIDAAMQQGGGGGEAAA